VAASPSNWEISPIPTNASLSFEEAVWPLLVDRELTIRRRPPTAKRPAATGSLAAVGLFARTIELQNQGAAVFLERQPDQYIGTKCDWVKVKGQKTSITDQQVLVKDGLACAFFWESRRAFQGLGVRL